MSGTSHATRWERNVATDVVAQVFLWGCSALWCADIQASSSVRSEFMIIQVLPQVIRGGYLVGSPRAFLLLKISGLLLDFPLIRSCLKIGAFPWWRFMNNELLHVAQVQCIKLHQSSNKFSGTGPSWPKNSSTRGTAIWICMAVLLCKSEPMYL